MNLRRLTIGPRMALGFGVLIVLMVGLGGYSFYKLEVINSINHEVTDDWLPGTRLAGELGTSVMHFRVYGLRLMADQDPEEVKQNVTRICMG